MPILCYAGPMTYAALITSSYAPAPVQQNSRFTIKKVNPAAATNHVTHLILAETSLQTMILQLVAA